jgi:hypothetical protein
MTSAMESQISNLPNTSQTATHEGSGHLAESSHEKRKLDPPSVQEPLHEHMEEDPAATVPRPSKRLKGNIASFTLDPDFLVIHKVDCDRSNSHAQHLSASYFLDPPRLFAKDNKASYLRGTKLITDVAEYLEDSEHIIVVIYRNYSCQEYHREIEKEFAYVKLSDYGVQNITALRPFLFVLKKDATLASCISEEMWIRSSSLKEALSNIQLQDPSIDLTAFGSGIPHGTGAWRLQAPYLQLYHFRGRMKELAAGLSSSGERTYINVLLRYIEEVFGDDYAEADELFARGLVTEKHQSKLFGPNEIVFTMNEGQPMAFVSKGLPKVEPSEPILLSCENWTFDGVFRRQETQFEVDEWPSESSGVMPIADLDIFPLKYAAPGVEDRLRRRGLVLWSCRKWRYMGYSYRSQGQRGKLKAARCIPMQQNQSLKLMIWAKKSLKEKNHRLNLSCFSFQ